jgi:hypothetical protein
MVIRGEGQGAAAPCPPPKPPSQPCNGRTGILPVPGRAGSPSYRVNGEILVPKRELGS